MFGKINLNRTIYGIQVRELLLVLLLYLFTAFSYFLALVINTGELYTYYGSVPLDYFLKLLFTIPIWWFFFRKIDSFPIWKKILLHLLALPFFIFLWINTYYAMCDLFGFGHLYGRGMVWDIYIPALFYIVQFGLFHVYDYYKKLQKQQKLAGELRQLALQSELSALKAQINPHFLYNVFNTISASVPPSQERTRVMIAKLSDLFRYQLKASKVEMVTVQEELEFVQKYLDLEKERFGDRLQYQIQVENGIQEEKIPPMLLQPLVENAIKHGISPLVNGGRINLSINKKEEELHFTIKDTGTGINGKSKRDLLNKGIGLTNTNRRLERMYNRSIQFANNQPSGLQVEFSIPIDHAVNSQ